MSHERSETIQRPDGTWVNVYGQGLPTAGAQLPHSGQYPTVQEAVMAAQDRSRIGHRFGQMMPPALPDPSLRALIDALRKK